MEESKSEFEELAAMGFWEYDEAPHITAWKAFSKTKPSSEELLAYETAVFGEPYAQMLFDARKARLRSIRLARDADTDAPQ